MSEVTNTNSDISVVYVYNAWGRFRLGINLNGNNTRTFIGHEYDKESEVYYFKARYYYPGIARFNNQDTNLGEIFIPVSMHRYLYGFANPLRYIDLLGYMSVTLGWDANSEPDLDHYNIYRNSQKIAESSITQFTDSGLTPDTTYNYRVSAVDNSGNEGTLSTIVSATTNELQQP